MKKTDKKMKNRKCGICGATIRGDWTVCSSCSSALGRLTASLTQRGVTLVPASLEIAAWAARFPHHNDPELHWFTGTREELIHVGVTDPLDPNALAVSDVRAAFEYLEAIPAPKVHVVPARRELTYCSFTLNDKFLGAIVLEGRHTSDSAVRSLLRRRRWPVPAECATADVLTASCTDADSDVTAAEFEAMWNNRDRFLTETECRELLGAKSVKEWREEHGDKKPEDPMSSGEPDDTTRDTQK